MSTQTFGAGSVINPKAISKPDIGLGPYQVTINEVIQNDDDCLFVKIIYPGDKMQMHQCFLPFDPMTLHHQIIDAFNYLFDKKVEPDSPMKNLDNLADSILTYTEIV
jgi:hypothetical protein